MKKFEVGQSFEVVEVFENPYGVKIGQHGLNLGRIPESPVYNNVYADGAWHLINSVLGKSALLEDNEIKPVGRLIIKSVK